MRIAFGFDIFYPETNGVITATINLAKNLMDLGHEVYFFVPKDKGFTDNTIEGGIHIIHVPAVQLFVYKGIKALPVYGWYLQKYFRKYHFDIIHDTSPWLLCQALNHAARRMHVPVLATHHTLIDNPIYIKYALKSTVLANTAQSAIWNIIFFPFFRLVWMITAPNKGTCLHVSSHVPNKDVRFISNGIDISRYDDSKPVLPLPAQIPISWASRNTLVYVGRLGYEKAVDVVIASFSLVVKTHPSAKLLIVGQGPAEEGLKEQARNLGINDSVLFTGLIPNDQIIQSRLLGKVNSFVTASLSENQAMTVIEALCSGCPVICARVQNMIDLVDSDAGWFFNPGEEHSLEKAMSDALDDPIGRDAKALRAKAALTRFDGRIVTEQFLKLYEELLEMKRNGYYVPGGEIRASMTLMKIAKQDSKAKKST
ncbi:MAG: glycosyltransferase [Sphaerochaetaceae bacterium]